MDENVGRGVSGRQEVDEFSRPAERARSISPDRMLSVVGNELRRAIHNSLIDAPDRTGEYDALVDRVADKVGDGKTEVVPDEHRRRVRIALHHTHLPKLADVGMIDYEADAGDVRFVGGEFEQEVLTLVESYEASE